MNTLRSILSLLLPLLLLTGVTLPACAHDQAWREDLPPDYLSPLAPRDVTATDDAGNLYVLIHELHAPSITMQVRAPDGSWSPVSDTAIPMSFVINEFVTHPVTGNPVALGAESIGVPGAALVAYEYTGASWVRTEIHWPAAGYGCAFDYDESGRLHFLYWDFDSGDLYYGSHAEGSTTTYPVSTLRGSSYRELEIQASSQGTKPIYASAYEATGGFVFTTVSVNGGENWGVATVAGYGFTGSTYSGQQMLTELDSEQRLHLFYRVELSGGDQFVRYRTLGLDGSLSAFDDLEFGSFGWNVFLLDDRPYYVAKVSRAGVPLVVSHLDADGWRSDEPDPGRSFSNLDGVDVVDGEVVVLATEHGSLDKHTYVTTTATLFKDSFE